MERCLNWTKMDNICWVFSQVVKVGDYATQELALRHKLFPCSQSRTLHLQVFFVVFFTSLRFMTFASVQMRNRNILQFWFLVIQHWHSENDLQYSQTTSCCLVFISVLLSSTFRHHLTVCTVPLHLHPWSVFLSILFFILWACLLPVAQFCLCGFQSSRAQNSLSIWSDSKDKSFLCCS